MSKIISAKLIDVDLMDEFPHANLVFLQLVTDEGVSGLGEIAMAYGVGAKAVLQLCATIVEKLVIGRDPFDSKAIWNDIEKKTYWITGRNVMHRGAQAAIDIALWDIKGKLLKQPIYNLLGGKVQQEIPLYANHWYGNVHKPEDYAERAKKVVVDGYKGLKFDPFRMSPEGVFSIPPRPLPRHWGELAMQRVDAVRQSVGELAIYIDAHGTLTLFDAIKWGKRLEKFDIAFFEEPVISYNPEETLEVRKKLDVPIAGGERLYCKQDFFPFIQSHAYDIVQPDICLAGGFTGMLEIAQMAEAKEILIQPHNCAGPISSAASVHFDMVTPNLLIQEWFPYWEDRRYQYVKGAYEYFVKDGVVIPPTLPGLGLELDEEKLARFKQVTIQS